MKDFFITLQQNFILQNYLLGSFQSVCLQLQNNREQL